MKSKKLKMDQTSPDIRRAYDWAYSRHVYPRLAKRYPNQWIAFVQGRILAHGKALSLVLQKARKTLEDWPEIPHLFVEKGIHVYYAHRP